MYCPKCGRERLSDATTYCSGCGFQMSQIEPFLDTPIKKRKKRSKLRRGLMQSYLLFAGVVGIFTLGQLFLSLFRVDSRWFIITSLVLLVLGVFRLAFAVFFESELLGPHEDKFEVEIAGNAEPKRIDGRSAVGIQDIFHTAATTSELQPVIDTVTDSTTKRLQVEED